MGASQEFPPVDVERGRLSEYREFLQEERAADTVGCGRAHRLHAGLHAERNSAVHTGRTHLIGHNISALILFFKLPVMLPSPYCALNFLSGLTCWHFKFQPVFPLNLQLILPLNFSG